MNNKEILITGGTGSLGKVLIRHIKKEYEPKGIRIYSRDELKQFELKNKLKEEGLLDNTAFILGDVADKDTLYRALDGVHIVINCAALKQVPACEENPTAAYKTNILGAYNLVQCCMDQHIEQCMHISTDKAVYPVNFYGVTKAASERIFLRSNVYHRTRFNVCRYGNVFGSRGSIIPLFHSQLRQGKITITDYRMSRFWVELDNVVSFITGAVAGIDELYQNGSDVNYPGHIFIPKMPSMKIIDIAKYIIDFFSFDNVKIEEIGIRPGEKLHECLITFEESRHMYPFTDFYVIYRPEAYTSEKKDRWAYYSDTNDRWLTKEDFTEMIKKFLQGLQK